MFLRRAAWLGPLVAAILLVFPANALAYLDPGTGSMMFQMAVAAIFAALFTMKLYWQRVKGAMKRLFRKSPDAS